MFFSPKQRLKNKEVDGFVKNKENCRRKLLLLAIGGTYVCLERLACCDVCTSGAISTRLDLTKPGPVSRKRKSSPGNFDQDVLSSLRARLGEERAVASRDNPDFLMLGFSFFCPDSTLDKLSTEALYIKTVDDLTAYGVRTELRDRLFSVIINMVGSIPPPVRRPRHR